jgi:hypothetical protein
LPIRIGGIVWAPIKPKKGVAKPRRCVVLVELPPVPPSSLKKYVVVGVTCDGGEYDPHDTAKYPPDQYIAIPHAEDGSCPTCFRLPSAAYVEFIEQFNENELEVSEGYLEQRQFDELVLKLKAYVRKQRIASEGRPAAEAAKLPPPPKL